MIRHQTTFAVALLVVALGFLLTGPTHVGATPARDGGTVTKTFQLTVNGTPPQGEFLYVRYDGQDDRTISGFVHFCGDLFQIDSKPSCQGNGTVYTGSVTFPVGSTIRFSFERSNQSTSQSDLDPYEIEVIQQSTETLNADATNSATYTYGRSTLPGTGVSDIARRTFLVVTAALVVLFSGVYLRRRLV